MNWDHINMIIKSNNIFTGTLDKPFKGYIAISGNKIAAVEKGTNYENLLSEDTKFIDLGESVITPGFVDTHTFFTGYVIYNIGVDVSKAKSFEKCIDILKSYESLLDGNATIFGHGWNPEAFGKDVEIKMLDKLFINKKIIVFSAIETLAS